MDICVCCCEVRKAVLTVVGASIVIGQQSEGSPLMWAPFTAEAMGTLSNSSSRPVSVNIGRGNCWVTLEVPLIFLDCVPSLLNDCIVHLSFCLPCMYDVRAQHFFLLGFQP